MNKKVFAFIILLAVIVSSVSYKTKNSQGAALPTNQTIFKNSTTLSKLGTASTGLTFNGEPIQGIPGPPGPAYTLPPATNSTLGGIKVGSGLSVTLDGTLNNTGVAGVASFNNRGGAVISQTGDYTANQITGISNVGKTGSYNDLLDKPTIPSAQVNSDWNASSGIAQILNKPSIPAAQVSSDWNSSVSPTQILNKPTIPTSLSQLSEDSTHRTVTDTEKSTWNSNSSPVQSVFGRTGTITAQSGDYTAAQVGADVAGSATSVIVNHENSYNHANLPTTSEKGALIGTSGTPGVANPFVTKAGFDNRSTAQGVKDTAQDAAIAGKEPADATIIKEGELSSATNGTRTNVAANEVAVKAVYDLAAKGMLLRKVKDYGAAGGGITDDSAAIQQTFSAAVPGDTIWFEPNETYKISSAVNLKVSGVTIKLNGAKLVTGSANNAITLNPDSTYYTAAAVLTANINHFTIPNGVSVAIGNMLRIRANTTYISGYQRGLFAKVISIVGSEAYVDIAPLYSFTSDQIVVYSELSDVEIDGGGGSIDLTAINAAGNLFGVSGTLYGANVHNLKITGSDYAGGAISLGGNNNYIHDNEIRNFPNVYGDGGTGRVGYGVALYGTNSGAETNIVVDCKHALTTSSRYFTSNNLYFKHNTVSQSTAHMNETVLAGEQYWGAPMDTHGNLENVVVEDNTIISAGNVACNVRNGKSNYSRNKIVLLNNISTSGIFSKYDEDIIDLKLSGNEISAAIATPLANVDGNFIHSSNDTFANVTWKGCVLKDGKLYAAAAPTSYAWLQNDFVHNSVQTANSPLGWRCVTAGTPGTWESVISGSNATVSWGGIGGTLSNQSDLNTALGGKEATANKGVANGYAGLGAAGFVPAGQLGSGTADASTYLRGDNTWAAVAGSSETQATILAKIAQQADGAQLVVQQGIGDSDSLAKAKLLDKSGNVVFSVNGGDGQMSVTSTNTPATLTRTTTGTNFIGGVINGFFKTTGQMTDGFGSGINLFARDADGIDNQQVSIGGVRDGADNSGGLSIQPRFYGGGTEAFRISAKGYMGVWSATPAALLDVRPPSSSVSSYFNGSTYTNNVTEAKTSGGTPFTVLAGASNYYYTGGAYTIGTGRPFDSIQVGLATMGAGITLTVEYWNGTAWTAVPSKVDGTSNLSQSGVVSWAMPTDWVANTVNGFSRYYIRFGTSTVPSVTPTAYYITPESADLMRVYAASGDSIPSLKIDRVGNVGIGTTSPGAKLDVAGDVKASGYIVSVLDDQTASFAVSKDESRITLATGTATVTLPAAPPTGSVRVSITVAGAAASGVTFAAGSGGSLSWGDAGTPTFTNSKTTDVVCTTQNSSATTTAAWRCVKGGNF